MSNLHRHETASLGARGTRLAGVGSEHARLVRLVLLSYTSWPGRPKRSPWPSNETLAARTGLTERQIERALAALRDAGIATSRVGRRAGARRQVGRLLELGLHAPCKALAPEAFDVGSLWTIARTMRDRPAALITAMVGAYMLASDAAGRDGLEEWGALGCSMADWRRFVGHRANASWTRRVRELELLGLIRRDGRRIFVSPPRAWLSLAVDARRPAEAPRVIPRAKPVERAPSRPAVAARRIAEPSNVVELHREPSQWVEVSAWEELAAAGIVAGRIGSSEEPRESAALPPARLLRVERLEQERLRTGTHPT